MFDDGPQLVPFITDNGVEEGGGGGGGAIGQEVVVYAFGEIHQQVVSNSVV